MLTDVCTNSIRLSALALITQEMEQPLQLRKTFNKSLSFLEQLFQAHFRLIASTFVWLSHCCCVSYL